MIASIKEQGKLSDEWMLALDRAESKQAIEDLYAPYNEERLGENSGDGRAGDSRRRGAGWQPPREPAKPLSDGERVCRIGGT